jgi:transposase
LFDRVCDTGGARRSWLRGLVDVRKRYPITVAAHNLGRVLRKLFGMGKPRALHDGFGLAALLQSAILWLLSSIACAPARLTPAP